MPFEIERLVEAVLHHLPRVGTVEQHIADKILGSPIILKHFVHPRVQAIIQLRVPRKIPIDRSDRQVANVSFKINPFLQMQPLPDGRRFAEHPPRHAFRHHGHFGLFQATRIPVDDRKAEHLGQAGIATSQQFGEPFPPVLLPDGHVLLTVIDGQQRGRLDMGRRPVDGIRKGTGQNRGKHILLHLLPVQADNPVGRRMATVEVTLIFDLHHNHQKSGKGNGKSGNIQ